MAVSEMSRRSRRRRAYPLRQSPEKAETGIEAYSTHFGNFRNLPKQTRMALGTCSAISGERDAAVTDYPARSAISDNGRDSQYVPEPSRNLPDRDWHRVGFFFFFFSGNCRTAPKTQTSKRAVIISRRRPHIALPLSPPLSSPRPPMVLAGSGREQSEARPRNLPLLLAAWPLPPPPGQEEVITTQILAPAPTHRGAPGASGGRRISPQPAPFYPAPPTLGAPPASALCSSFLPPLPPFFSLQRSRTHRDKG